MAKISMAHPMRVALVFCAVATTAAFSPAPASANPGLLEGLTGQVEQAVNPIVQASPPVQQVAETVTTTAQEATARIAPSATKAAAAATSSAVGTAGASAGQADDLTRKAIKVAGDAADGVESAAGTATRSTEAAAGVASVAGTATQTAKAAVHGATAGAEAATGVTLPDPSVPSTTSDPAGPAAGAPEADASANSAAAPAELPPPAPRTTYVPPPGNNGSTGAPLPRWVAYVWPAVALTGPALASFGESWGQAIVRLATGAAAGSGGEGGVAGVHASGGRPEASSVPLFSRLPSDVARAFSSVPTPIFIYLGLLLAAVIAVGLAVRHEIALGRRR